MSGQRLRAAAVTVLSFLLGPALLLGCGGSTSTIFARTVPVPEACEGFVGGDLEACESGAKAKAAEEGEELTFEEPEEELPPEEEVDEDEESVKAEPGEIEDGAAGALDQTGTIYIGNPEGYEATISLERGRVERPRRGR